MGGLSSKNTSRTQSNRTVSIHRTELEEIYKELCFNGSFDKKTFLIHFAGPSGFIGELLFQEMTNTTGDASQKFYQENHHRQHLMNEELFISKATQVIEKAYKARRIQLNYYINLLTSKKSFLTEKDIREMVAFCCKFGFLVGNYPTKYLDEIEQDPSLAVMAKSCVGENEQTSQAECLDWIEEANPNLFAAFQSWIHIKLTSILPKSHFHMVAIPPEIDQGTGDNILSLPLLWHLCCVLPSCYIEPDKKIEDGFDEDEDDEVKNGYSWNLLYKSSQHGLGMNRFKHKCMDYKSPNVSLFRFRSGLLLALALDGAWKDSSERFGGSYTSLLEVLPNPSQIVGMPNIVYLKSSGRNVYTGLKVGEGAPEKFLLDSDFYKAEILYKGRFTDEVTEIEMWGCGGIKAAIGQQKQKAWEKKEVEKRIKVKRSGLWEDNPDRSLLEMGGIQVKHNERGDF